MSTPQSVIIKKHLEKLLQYLGPVLPFANCHMVDYYTKSLYDFYIPHSVRTEIKKIGHDNAINMIFQQTCGERTPELNEFIKKMKEFCLCTSEICLSASKLQEKLKELGCDSVAGVKLQVFIKPKKSHEVEVLSAIAASLKKIGNTSHIIDIGDGKGYLSSMLALHHKIPVLGVDSSSLNTTNAVKRVEKLGKVWHGIMKSPKKSVLPLDKQRDCLDMLLYKQVTQFVTDKTDFKRLICDVFMEDNVHLGVVGLHTCGNLSSTSIKIFSNNVDVRTICNVGCCYHLLSEKFETNNNSADENVGFPMSDFLIAQNFKLGRNARMLSAQSVDRILHNKELPNRNVFYRAVFEVLLQKYDKQQVFRNVGKFQKACDNFVDYARKAMKRVEVHLCVTDEELVQLYDLYAAREKELYVFNLLRCMLAPVIEASILLDRLLYLQERGYYNSFLVKLFDPVISPRCYGLIGFKS